MLKLAVLCSGGLGLDTLTKLVENASTKVSCVLTDSNSLNIIEFLKENNIPFFAGNPRKGQGFNFLKQFNIDVIASINYLFLIDEDIITHSNKLTFNIHGSLLPKYRGRTPHVWAIINGETKAGITAHVIDKGCDTGKIIYQIEIPILKNDTGAIMLEKYASAYFPLVEKIIEDLKTQQLKLRIQDENEATYFGKRTPLDGEINWDLPIEAIYNWVRAQSYPYPGAFSFYENQKIIIDWVEIVPQELDNSLQNGTILETEPKVKVKVSNGILILTKIRQENCNFEVGKHFGNENRR